MARFELDPASGRLPSVCIRHGAPPSLGGDAGRSSLPCCRGPGDIWAGVLRGLCGLSSGEGARAGGQFGSHEHLGDIYSLGRDEITRQPALASGWEGWQCWAPGSGLSSYLFPPRPRPLAGPAGSSRSCLVDLGWRLGWPMGGRLTFSLCLPDPETRTGS